MAWMLLTEVHMSTMVPLGETTHSISLQDTRCWAWCFESVMSTYFVSHTVLRTELSTEDPVMDKADKAPLSSKLR
jgi:hypothetical protein